MRNAEWHDLIQYHFPERIFKLILLCQFQIWKKLENMYDMKEIEKNEAMPEGLLEKSEFCLPEDDFGDLLRKKDELNRGFVAPQTNGQSTLRRKQRDLGMHSLLTYEFIVTFFFQILL